MSLICSHFICLHSSLSILHIHGCPCKLQGQSSSPILASRWRQRKSQCTVLQDQQGVYENNHTRFLTCFNRLFIEPLHSWLHIQMDVFEMSPFCSIITNSHSYSSKLPNNVLGVETEIWAKFQQPQNSNFKIILLLFEVWQRKNQLTLRLNLYLKLKLWLPAQHLLAALSKIHLKQM